MSKSVKQVRIGTRRSSLARAQAEIVAGAMRKTDPSMETRLVTIDTKGDRRGGSLSHVGGKGLFTAELESALRDGSLDIAVHSAKDMPVAMDEDLVIAAVPKRDDPADVLFSKCGSLDDLPGKASVGTCSPRRAVQLRAVREDLNIVSVRGNIETRMEKVSGSKTDLDAVVLAAAGLRRSGLYEENQRRIYPLGIDVMLPAAGQGTLAVQSLAASDGLSEILKAVNDSDSADSLFAERRVVKALGADCGSAVAVYVRRMAYESWFASAMVSRSDGGGMMLADAGGSTADDAAELLITQLLKSGADKLLI